MNTTHEPDELDEFDIYGLDEFDDTDEDDTADEVGEDTDAGTDEYDETAEYDNDGDEYDTGENEPDYDAEDTDELEYNQPQPDYDAEPEWEEDEDADEWEDTDEPEFDEEADEDNPADYDEEADEPEETFTREYVEKLRAENAKYRTRAKNAPNVEPLNKTFSNLLGDTFDPEQPDYAAVSAAIEKRDEQHKKELRQAQLEKEVYRHANAAGIDPELALDSMSFRKAISSLNPASEDFAEKVLGQLKATARRYPSAPKERPQTRSSGDFTGGNAAPRDDDTSVEALIKKRRKRMARKP